MVTCAPNFPSGRVFDGYRNKLATWDRTEGIDVLRVWSYITANEGFLRRSLDYASYMVSATVAAPFVRGVDIVVATSPQLFTASAGWMASVLLRRPFVFELRDLWPESIKAVGALQDGRLLRALERIEKFLYRRATAVVCVTHAFRDNLVARGIDASKIHVVTNGADLARFHPMSKDAVLASRFGLHGRFVAGYFGTHGMAHRLGTLLEAAAMLQIGEGSNIRLLLLGDGADKQHLKAQAAKMKLENVIFLDPVPRNEISGYLSLVDVSIIHLKKTDLFKTVIPSKLFECMAMGIPVLHGVQGESAEIVRENGVGIPFEPENAEALSRQLLRLSEDAALCHELSANGPPAAVKFDRSALAIDMLDILTKIQHNAAGENQ